MTSAVDDGDLQQCLQTESLSIVSDEDGESTQMGSMCVHVALAASELSGPPSIVVRIESSGKISGSLCGTVITARLSLRLDTIEHQVKEFVKVRQTARLDKATVTTTIRLRFDCDSTVV